MGWNGLTGAAKGQWRSVLGSRQGARSRGCVAACLIRLRIAAVVDFVVLATVTTIAVCF